MPNALVIIIDQMRSDYVNLLRNYCKKRGTKSFISKLFQRGATYSKGQVEHLPTSTPTGHATISTGTTPRKSGIVGLEWYDKEQERIVDVCEGNSAKYLMSKSLAAVARQHDYKTYIIAGKREPAILLGADEADLTLYPELYCNGKKTVLLMQERKDVAEIPPTMKLKYTPSWVTASKLWIRPRVVFDRRRSPAGDVYPKELDGLVAKTTELVLKNEIRSVSKWMMFTSFSGVDDLGHLFGPCSEDVINDLFRIDKWLRSFCQKLSLDTYIVLTSDHGCTKLKAGIKPHFEPRYFEPSLEKRIPLFFFEILNEKARVIDVRVLPKEISAYIHYKNCKEFGIVAEGICMIYTRKSVKAVKSSLAKLLRNCITNICCKRSNELPTRLKEKITSLSHKRTGDMIIIPAEGYRFLKPKWSVGLGEHGSTSNEEQRIPIMFAGPNIRKGVFKFAKLRDIAPTLAWGLNIPVSPFLKDGGKVLTEVYSSSNRICNST